MEDQILTTSKLAWTHPLPPLILHQFTVLSPPQQSNSLKTSFFDSIIIRWDASTAGRLLHLLTLPCACPPISSQPPTLCLPNYSVYRNVVLYHFSFPPTHRPPPLTPLWYIIPSTRCQEYTRSLCNKGLVLGRWFIKQVNPTRLSSSVLANTSRRHDPRLQYC
jgi:hypothetical protein